jgi:hypothetical protein
MFNGRTLLIATKHRKESVIAPILENGLGVSCYVPSNFDTDVFGTFSGEIKRKYSAVETVRKKCLAAMDAFDCDLGLASEGSFGAHPSLFFAQADEEFLIFIDKKNDLEIIVRELSLDTNFYGEAVTSYEALTAFAHQVHFPSHAIILRSSADDDKAVIKAITSKEDLKKYYNYIMKVFGTVYAETDMRAHYNPTRMKVIEVATQKLLQSIQSLCPECMTPGFVVTSAKPGLPCSWCANPTRSTRSHVYCCKKCQYTKEINFPHQKMTEEPTFCDYCNP